MHKFKGLLGVFGLIGVTALAGCSAGAPPTASPGAGVECAQASIAVLDDDAQRTALYAIEQGIVTSDLIPSVKVSFLQIPALIQASGSGQFNYVQSSLNGLVLARENGGADLRIVAFVNANTGGGLAMFTRKGSDIESPADLEGKTLATPGFGSAGTVMGQIVLDEKYGIDANLEGGSITWVELDPATMLNALKAGDIDAMMVAQQGAWIASNDPDLTTLTQVDQDFYEIADEAWPIGAVVVADGEFVDANLDCVNEFQRMLRESVDYATENHSEYEQEIADVSGVPAAYIDYWWQDDHYRYGGVVDDEWKGWASEFYRLAYEHGLIPVDQDVDEITVDPAE